MDDVRFLSQSKLPLYPARVSIGPVDLLRERGVQVTAQRLAVLRAVSVNPHGLADALGFEISEAQVIYWGRCPECVART